MSYSAVTRNFVFDATAANGKQLVDILFPVIFGQSLFNRKDTYNLKFNINTGGDDLDVFIYIATQTKPIYVATINQATLGEVVIDVANIIGVTKYWQPRLVGVLSEFKLTDITFDYDTRPEPTTFIHYLYDLGPNKKRIRVLPFTIDTLGEEVSIVPIVDGAALAAQIVTSTYPKTFFYQFTEDIFPIDLEVTLHGCCLFELYKIHAPVGVQVLPIAKRFDQVGPVEMFKYGKLKEFSLRLIAFGGTSIPYRTYFQDTLIDSGNIAVLDSKEGVYTLPAPKTTAGEILRIELGPTNFDFHRYEIVAKCAKAGRDTELEYVPMQDNYQGQQ